MLTIALIAVAIIVVLFTIIVATRPSEFRVTRSAAIVAPPPAVFEHVNNLRRWEAWSPWARLDPDAKTSFAGPDAGNGATMAWSGNNKVGEGRMTITESRPNQLVRFKLEFVKPFKGNNTAEFTFQPKGDQTVVTWTMSGTNNFLGKLIGLFMNCDKMVGGQFEKGLATMKSVAEAAASQVG